LVWGLCHGHQAREIVDPAITKHKGRIFYANCSRLPLRRCRHARRMVRPRVPGNCVSRARPRRRRRDGRLFQHRSPWIGFGVGIWLFVKFGLVAQGAAFAIAPSSEPASASSPTVTVAPATARISRPFAVVVLAIVGGLAWWAWYEFIRSPYLTHRYMTLALQFRLPAGMTASAEAKDVQIVLDEGGHRWPAYLNEAGWRGHQSNREVILASVSMMYKTSRRVVTLSVLDPRSF